MDTLLDLSAVTNIGAGGIVIIVIISIIRGWLVPRKTVTTLAENWRSSIDDKNAVIAMQQEQIRSLVDDARLSHDVVKAVGKVAGSDDH